MKTVLRNKPVICYAIRVQFGRFRLICVTSIGEEYFSGRVNHSDGTYSMTTGRVNDLIAVYQHRDDLMKFVEKLGYAIAETRPDRHARWEGKVR